LFRALRSPLDAVRRVGEGYGNAIMKSRTKQVAAKQTQNVESL
jgi:hypothetical protein